MEYLRRTMQGMDLISNFKYHPKCNKLKITNLCFVDDLLLFVGGDVESVKLMMSKFRDFPTATGLKASIPKCKIRVDDIIKMVIQVETGFDIGIMPFKYLGVPLGSRKLSITISQPLIDKILARLNH
ncbi:uncharacterized protein LOC131651381 [Vicia villosa]|uniref:uncharacterized protein LOC131651381 n=1 Tax=Vicia villosa TaxID=3911 RepID=UPI00273B9ECE|nr:uncharacterized protein LOC131651381 [Vicia villosa]